MNSKLSKNAVPLDQAQEWTKRWQQSCPGNCKAFLIPSVDLIEVLFEMATMNGAKINPKTVEEVTKAFQNTKVRAYMAIEAFNDKNTPERMKGATMEKVLMVGTKEIDGIYHDIIDGKIQATGDVLKTGGVDSGIYDFSIPCPPFCDPGSPLNQ